MVTDAITNNYFIGVDTSSTSLYSLPTSHAYSVFGAYQLKDVNGNVVYRLYRVENPWGYDVYNGPWSDNSPLWTPAFKAQVPYVDNTSDGAFFIDENDFVNAFNTIQVGYVYQGWKHSYYSRTGDDGSLQAYTFTLPSAQQIFVLADLYDYRMYPTGCKSSYTEGTLSIYIGSTLLGSTTVSDELGFSYSYYQTLAAGTYTAKLQIGW
jgi:hypothetical protein